MSINKYFTIFNGMRAFMVVHDTAAGSVKVYKYKTKYWELEGSVKSEAENYRENPCVVLHNVRGVMIDQGTCDKCRGSSVLIDVNGSRLYCVHGDIVAFDLPQGENVEFYGAPIRGDMVTYPWVRTGQAVYLILEARRIPCYQIEAFPGYVPDVSNPYDCFIGPSLGIDEKYLADEKESDLKFRKLRAIRKAYERFIASNIGGPFKLDRVVYYRD